jgi:hypothetical protein
VPDIDLRIADIIRVLTLAFDTMYVLRCYMYQPGQLSPEERSNFRVAAIFFGELCRKEDGLKCSVTVKGHLVECHAPDQMDEYGNLSQFLEETIEKMHKDNNDLNRRFAREPDWEKRRKSILLSIQRSESVAVQAYLESVNQGSKRKYTPEVAEAKREAAWQKKENRKEALANKMLSINTAREQV